MSEFEGRANLLRAVENRPRVATRGPLGHLGLSLPSMSNFDHIFHESGLLRVFQVVLSPFVAKKTEWKLSRTHLPGTKLFEEVPKY